jgi:hypothetical protein
VAWKLPPVPPADAHLGVLRCGHGVLLARPVALDSVCVTVSWVRQTARLTGDVEIPSIFLPSVHLSYLCGPIPTASLEWLFITPSLHPIPVS